MKTLELEQITALEARHDALVQTARAGAVLAGFVRGAIRGCNERVDPTGHTRQMLTAFLEMAGFEVES